MSAIMSIISILFTIVGLCLFETISSIDNAIINAQVLSTMGQKARKWFLFWGLIFAVFIIRGLLPWFIVWATNPSLGLIGSLTATFSSDPKVMEAIEMSAPILLMGGEFFFYFYSSTGFFWKKKTLVFSEKNFSTKTEYGFSRSFL